MTEPRLNMLVVGSGGLLGSAVLRQRGRASAVQGCPGIEWRTGRAADQLARRVRGYLSETDAPTSIAWCAGAGVVGTSQEELDAENRLLATTLDVAGDHSDVTFLLASSAGGVYAGVKETPIDELATPAPLADYGRNKLKQEAMLEEWVDSTRRTRGVIARFTNLYGPGQRLEKRQGLVSQLCYATLTRRSTTIYVPLDTIRDYVYTDDAARLTIATVRRAQAEPEGSVVTKIIGCGRSISIGGVLAEVRRVVGRRPDVVFAPSPTGKFQGSTLQFRSVVWPDLGGITMSPLPVGIARVAADLRAQLAGSGTPV